MPKLSKQFHLEVTVEQFLEACSMVELQEVSLLLDGYIQRAEQRPPPTSVLWHTSLDEEKVLPFSKDFNPKEMQDQRRAAGREEEADA